MNNRQFVLAALRCATVRVQLVREELIMIGTALSHELISPETAVEWCNEVAPGCLDVVSPSVVKEVA